MNRTYKTFYIWQTNKPNIKALEISNKIKHIGKNNVVKINARDRHEAMIIYSRLCTNIKIGNGRINSNFETYSITNHRQSIKIDLVSLCNDVEDYDYYTTYPYTHINMKGVWKYRIFD